MSRRSTLLALVLSGVLGCAASAPAQYPNCGFNCTAGDVTVDSARVEVPGNTCVSGDDVTVSIYATFSNGTRSTRYAVRVLGDLYVNGAVVTSLDACVAESIPPGAHEYLLMMETIPCSARVEFRLVVVSWSASAESCADTPGCADRKAKCWSPSGGTLVISVPALVVGFASNSPACLGGPVRFTNSTTGGKTPYQYQWEFGDGMTSTEANPLHTYAAAGDYMVSLTVRDAAGATRTALQDVVVLEPPFATADNGGPYCPGETIELYAEGGVTYKWTGPSGFSSTVQNPTIPSAGAANAGSYTVTVTDAYSCSAQAATDVFLDATPPDLDVPADTIVECGDPHDPSVTGEATAFDRDDPTPVVAYSDAETAAGCDGAKRILRTWTATDACGNRASGVQTIDVVDGTAPSLSVSSRTFECDGTGNVTAISTWLASAVAVDACGPATTFDDFVALEGACAGVGSVLVTFTAVDACGNTAEATAPLAIVDTTPPDASDDEAVTPEDEPVLIAVLANDTDRCDGELRIVSVSAPSFGRNDIVGDLVEFSPPPDVHGIAEFRYTVEDCSGNRDTANVRVAVTPVNDAPVAVGEAVSLSEDSSVALVLTGSDVDDDALTYAIVSGPERGTIVGFDAATGTLTYVPEAEYYGPDAFTFEVCDPSGACDDAVISITVRPVNDAPVAESQTVWTREDEEVAIQLLGSDVDGDPLTYRIVSAPQHGTLVGFDPATGAVTYVPGPDYYGPDAFTFEVCDGTGVCTRGTVTMAVAAVNDPPGATDQTRTTAEDTPTGFFSLAIVDPDHTLAELECDCIEPPQHGTVERGPDHTVNYTPDPDFSGVDSFRYRVCDPEGACDTATVTVYVTATNDNPSVDGARSVTTAEDTPIRILVTHSDPDGDPLTCAIADPAHGSVSPSGGTIEPPYPATSAFVYTPDSDYFGNDQILITCDDGRGGSDSVTIEVTVTPVNDAPTTADQAVTLDEDGSVGVRLVGSDVDDDALTYAIVSGPERGTIVGFDAATGTLTYVPEAEYYGPDAFTFEVCDPSGACDDAVISITVRPVNDAPVAESQTVWTREDEEVAIQLVGSDVDGDPLTYGIVSAPQHGTLVGFNPATGAVMYVPGPDYYGPDAFTFEVCDGTGACTRGTVTIAVAAVNDPPVATDQTRTTAEDTPTGFFSLAIVDPDHTLAELVCDCIEPPQHGTVERGPNHTVNYTPDPDFFGTDTFFYKVCDPNGACDTARVTVRVLAVNDAPSANDASFTVSGTDPSAVTLTASDPDGDPLTYRLLLLPRHGTIVDFDTTTGTLTYVANPGYEGIDVFSFEACDPSGACGVGVIDLLVIATARAPIAEPQWITTYEDTPADVTLRGTDEDGDVLTYAILVAPAHGRIESFDSTTGELVYVPGRGFDGDDLFAFQVCDPSGACAVSAVAVVVLAVNNAPTVASMETSVTAGVAVDIALVARDPDEDPVTFSIVQPPSHGIIVAFDPASGRLVYLPDEGYAGPDVFVFQACDPSGACAQGLVQTFAVLAVGGGGAVGICERRVIISEVAWAGTAADSSHEWIELRNVGDSDIDLAGWTLRWRPLVPTSALDGFWRSVGLSGIVGAFSGSSSASVLPADEGWLRVDVRVLPTTDVVLLERASNDTVATVEAALVYADTLALGRRLDLPDSGGVMELIDPYGCVVDRVNERLDRAEGWPAGNAVPPASMQRSEALDWSTSWGPFVSGDDKAGNAILGTPGAANPPSIGDVLALFSTDGGREIPIGASLVIALPGDLGAWATEPLVVRLTDRIEGALAAPAGSLSVETSHIDGVVALIVDTSGLRRGEYVLWVRSAQGEIYAAPVTVRE